MYDESQRLSDTECVALFDRIFPSGFSSDDVVTELAPEGWERSQLLAIFHPSLDQVFREAVQSHENLKSLRRPSDERPIPPAPRLEEVAASFRTTAVDDVREVRDLVGRCAWDIFSDNHEVIAPDGRMVDLGSFRGTGAFLADYLNRRIGDASYDYMDFYMGTSWITVRADVSPVYLLLFRRLQACGCDWTYHFPQLNLVDLRPLSAALKKEQQPEWEAYDPSAAFEKEQEEQQRDQELSEMRASLDEAHREAIDLARQSPPPLTVAAYYSVYGRLPTGWPPG